LLDSDRKEELLVVIEVFERTDVVVEAVGTPPCCWVAQVARVVGESESSFGGEPVTVNVRFQDMRNRRKSTVGRVLRMML
jgi:hypothetical protein